MDSNNALARVDALESVNVSGTVTMSLLEIDKLRAQTINAQKLAKDLAIHAKEVKVTIVPGDGSKNRFIKDANVKEVVSYKGLDEFREIVAAEEYEKLQAKIEANLTRLAEAEQAVVDERNKAADARIESGQLLNENKKLKKDLNQAEKERDTLRITLEATQKAFDEFRVKNDAELAEVKQREFEATLQGQIADLRHENETLRKDLAEAKKKQSWFNWK